MARALVLGGTGLIGPSVVETLQKNGHQVTVFNRNRRNPDAFKNIEQLVGDRNVAGGHDALKGKKWDMVFDIPASNPKWVHDAATILKGNVGHYLYISSTAAFKDPSIPYQDETFPTADPSPLEPYDPAPYGKNKAKCEQIVMENFGSGGIVVRPGYIVGRRDGTGRWLPYALRVQRGGELIAAGKMDDAAQYIDVRDLAEFMVKLAEDKKGGIYNATGPQTVWSSAEMLYGMKAAFSNDARFTWIDDPAFLREQRVSFAIVLPKTSDGIVYSASSVEKAKAAGLKFRPLVDTVRDGIAWYNALPEGPAKVAAAGLTVRPQQPNQPPPPPPFDAKREAEILAAWHAKQGTK
jgi:2'-hydroxyisoflavone reductase